MTSIKKRIALAAMAWALCACGSSTSTSGPGGGSGTEATSTGTTGTASTGTASTGTASTGSASTGTGMGGAGTASTSTGTMSSSTGTSSGGACTVTLSGAETGTFTCSVEAAWDGSQNTSAIAFTPASALPMGVMTAEGGGSVSGQFVVMQYPYADFMKGGYAVVSTGATAWESGPDDHLGTQSLNLTSVTTMLDTGNAKTFTTHGTFDATCPYVNGTPDPGTTVTVHIDF